MFCTISILHHHVFKGTTPLQTCFPQHAKNERLSSLMGDGRRHIGHSSLSASVMGANRSMFLVSACAVESKLSRRASNSNDVVIILIYRITIKLITILPIQYVYGCGANVNSQSIW